MRKINKYSLLFAFVIIFIICGLWGECFEQLKWKTVDLAAGLKHGNISSFFDYKYYVDDISNKELGYHDQMMDINSVKDNLLGTRVIHKDDTTVVKADSGSLTSPSKKLSEADISQTVDQIIKLKNVSEKNGAKFLYCAAPTKHLAEELPSNVENCFQENYDSFLRIMSEKGVPFLDFLSSLNLYKQTNPHPFYFTDHHWTTKTGFNAAKSICEKLDFQYGFEYYKEYVDISNYTVKSYHDWFLGSLGKKVGFCFTWKGADDFDLITPNFKTNITESQPIKNTERNGSFEDTVLYMENMKKEYYKINTYATYSGGDFRLQIMKNNLNPNGKKILLIRDSFACVVAPFLTLQTSELHICDMRNYE